jgi:hypothetical protein
MYVECTMNGLALGVIDIGLEFGFDEAISFKPRCANQAGVDSFWEKLGDGANTAPAAGSGINTASPGRSCPRGGGDRLAQLMLELAKGLFDRIDVWEIGRQEPQFRGLPRFPATALTRGRPIEMEEGGRNVRPVIPSQINRGDTEITGAIQGSPLDGTAGDGRVRYARAPWNFAACDKVLDVLRNLASVHGVAVAYKPRLSSAHLRGAAANARQG